MTDDRKIRQQALDPQGSFIVQAPAGSGKTELLIQRLLVLLARVAKPEEILAITFTRKAASEMRERVLLALETAATMARPERPHAAKTWDLAQAVLQQDKALNWQLRDNPNRLIIQTIDALSLSLVQKMPVLSQLGAPPAITASPASCYEQAVQALLATLESRSPWVAALSDLLAHLDNNITVVQRLLTSMLAKRDQWLAHVVSLNGKNLNNQDIRDDLEGGLRHCIQAALEALQPTFTKAQKNELFECVSFASQQLQPRQLSQLKALPEVAPDELPHWQAIATILLKKDGKFRKTVTITQGFPAPSSCVDRTQQYQWQVMKTRMQALLKEFADNQALEMALQNVLSCPPPSYNDQQWQLLTSLLTLLPVLAAQLTLVFKQRQEVDFIEISQRALHALGPADQPTDLALILDTQIQHLLVDEFQDTATTQLQLFERLTAGWQSGDGRTLFLVGDPMQSIYRFRQAEVGLFLRAQTHGLGDIALTPLTLTMNFRSNQPLVEWMNTTFMGAFPKVADITTGAVTFSPAQATLACDDQAVHFYPQLTNDTMTEAETIVKLIAKIQLDEPTSTIAILVKSRSHLPAVLSALQQAELPYQAIDIETLAGQAAVQDAVTLTRALLHLADRIAWLALLRAPWCGLTLTDCHALVANNFNQTLWSQMCAHQNNPNISADGHQRLNNIIPILKDSLNASGRHTLRQWIEVTWLHLKGPSLLATDADQLNLKAYFELLADLEAEREGLDAQVLAFKLQTLFASPNPKADERLTVMTIHKAKGLEFDHVILPGLTRKSPVDAHQLLLWQERPRTDLGSDLLLAPIRSSATEDAIYRYLRQQDQRKAALEKTRLLYVATTRAKRSLHLMLSLPVDPDKEAMTAPSEGSLVAPIWPMIKTAVLQALPAEALTPTVAAPSSRTPTPLLRIDAQTQFQPIKQPLTRETSAENNANTGIAKASETLVFNQERAVLGTIIHQVFEAIGNSDLSTWTAGKITALVPYWRKQLLQAGIAADAVATQLDQLKQAVTRTLADPQGQWLFSNEHIDIHNEYALTAMINSKLMHIVIDRTFIDKTGTRWIIDYKMADPQDKKIEQFINEQKNHYQQQLSIYAQVLALQEQRPTKTALYFPFLNPNGLVMMNEEVLTKLP